MLYFTRLQLVKYVRSLVKHLGDISLQVMQ